LNGPALPSREAAQYEEFFGFVQSPFTLAPDPHFLYRSASHNDAIQLLIDAIQRRDGIAVLSGDVGTGKTTICRTVLERLDHTVFTSLVLNPFVSADELIRAILLDFGVVSRETVRSGRISSATTDNLVSTLRAFLASLASIGATGVLVIDEAQHLSRQVLEQLYVLSNLEAHDTKLLQIVLVGQLNLLDLLERPDERQLDRRIALRAVLEPLDRVDVEAYVAHRIAVAMGGSSVTFDAAALELVHRSSRGVPRVINLLCDRALTSAAHLGVSMITRDIARGAAGSLGLPAHRLATRRWWRFFRWGWASAAL